MVEGPSEELWSLGSLVAGKTTLPQPADPLLANFILTLFQGEKSGNSNVVVSIAQ